MQDLSHEILSDLERQKIIAFVSDQFLFNAVKKYVLAVANKQGIVEQGVEHRAGVNWALSLAWPATQNNGAPRSDEELGQSLRALTYAVQLVESGFKELSEMPRPEPLQEETINPSE